MHSKDEIIALASDHGGYELKNYIRERLTGKGYKVKDYGTFSNESVDYPDFIHPLAAAVDSGEYRTGIIICGTGNGAQMVANKYKNVRAALCWSEEITKLARQHNNANILSLPGRFLDQEFAMKLVDIFLNTDFEEGRHLVRIEKISLKK